MCGRTSSPHTQDCSSAPRASLSRDSAFPAFLLPAITVRASSPQKMNNPVFWRGATPVAGRALLGSPGPGKTHGLNSALRYPPQQHLLQEVKEKMKSSLWRAAQRHAVIYSMEPRSTRELLLQCHRSCFSSGCAKGCVLRGAGQGQPPYKTSL